MRALALLGPRARERDLVQFQKSPCDFQVLRSPEPTRVTEALRAKPDVVVLFGGDGTLNRHLGALVESKLPLLLVPSGSGNDFAKCNGISDVEDSIRAWTDFLEGRAIIFEADLGLVEMEGGHRRYFSCCANIGLDADAARRTNHLPNWMKERNGYLIGGLGAIASYTPKRITISGEGIPAISEKGWFVAISNTPIYGGGLKIAPKASINDGLLDITYLRETPRWNLVRHYPKILSGTHVQLPMVTQFTTRELSIETELPMPIYADGDHMGTTPGRITIASRALFAIRPKVTAK